MYEELIKKLRTCEDDCSKCPMMYDEQAEQDLVREHCAAYEAVDAIEELSKDLERSKEWEAFWEKEANEALKKFQTAVARMPRWIPVTERLPEEYEDVLCYYEYFRYGDYNCMFRTIDRGYYGDGRWGGEAGQGHKNKVLYWMPLPEPPKEETE